MNWHDDMIAYPDDDKRYDVAKLGPPDAWSDGGVVGRGELWEHDPTTDYEPSDWFCSEGRPLRAIESGTFEPLWYVDALESAEVTE